MVRFRQSTWKWAGKFVFAFMVAAMGATFLSQNSYALTNLLESPDPNNIIPTPGTPPDNTFRHILKREDTSTIDKIEMAAYYDSPSPSYIFYIFARDTVGPSCRTYVTSGNSSRHVQVTLSVNTTSGPKSITYNIPMNFVCNGPTNTINRRTSLTNDRFFGGYEVPAEFTPANVLPDPETGLYRLGITIALGPISEVPEGMTFSNKRQSITFKTALVDPATIVNASTSSECPNVSCTRYLSTVPIGAGSRNYSTLGEQNNQHFTIQRFKFGLPCSVGLADNRIRTVKVYDVDNQTNWGGAKSTFSIEKYDPASGAWIKLSFNINDPSQVSGIDVPKSNSTNLYPIAVSGTIASVTFQLEPHTNYRLAVNQIKSRNLLGIGLPEETIFGDMNCSRNLTGKIDANPDTDPIETGRDVTLTASSYRTEPSLFNSQFAFSWRTWYDTGDGVYQFGETPGCPFIGSATRIQDKTTNPQVLTSCTMRADTSKSGGGAVAICAQLMMAATDGLTDISTTVTAPNGLIRCIKIGKYPHFEARNGDVWAGGSFTSLSSSCTVTSAVVQSSQRSINGLNYSSFATYGVTSLGIVNGFGSSGLTAGTPTWESLVFGNDGSDPYGYFYNPVGSTAPPSTGRCLNDPFAVFGPAATATSASNSVDLSMLTQSTTFTTNGTLTVTASAAIPQGKRIVIYASDPGSVIRIASDIKYDPGSYNSISKLPQIVILGEGSIVVAGSGPTIVREIDGVLAAKNSLYTCDATPRLNVCNDQLTINGAVVVGKKVVAVRSAGAEGPTFTGMAETFNLRPDEVLSTTPAPGDNDVFIRTINETEVPPRF